MASFTAPSAQLSGSTGGRPIKVVETATPGTLIHATGAETNVLDEVTLYACNTTATDRALTLEIGGVTDPDDRMIVTVPAQAGWVPILVAHRLRGDGAAARNIRAFCAAAANAINVIGDLNRITN